MHQPLVPLADRDHGDDDHLVVDLMDQPVAGGAPFDPVTVRQAMQACQWHVRVLQALAELVFQLVANAGGKFVPCARTRSASSIHFRQSSRRPAHRTSPPREAPGPETLALRRSSRQLVPRSTLEPRQASHRSTNRKRPSNRPAKTGHRTQISAAPHGFAPAQEPNRKPRLHP